MNQLTHDEGYVINLYDLSDTSLIAHIFLKHQGVIKGVAKGAKSPKNQYAGCFEISNKVEVYYQPAREPSDLHTIKEVSIKAQAQGTRASYPKLLTVSYYCSLIDYWVKVESEEIYDLFSRAMKYVEGEELKWRGITYFEEELSKLLGYSKRVEEVQKIYRSNIRINKLRQELEKVIK